MTQLAINSDCLWDSLMAMAQIGATPRVSGAGHDAKYLPQVCPTAMIFIPCKDAISHNEIEDTTKEHAAAGCDVPLQALVAQAGT
jgi:beta-ureidopropionase / N-carbamoyl-L-amino-acid hydrolase